MMAHGLTYKLPYGYGGYMSSPVVCAMMMRDGHVLCYTDVVYAMMMRDGHVLCYTDVVCDGLSWFV